MPHGPDRRAFLTLLSAMPFIPGIVARAATAGRTPLVPPKIVRVAAAGDRSVAVSQWMARGRHKGVISFSHGFGASPGYYPDFIAAWTGAGYDVIAPLHVDSREYVPRGKFDASVGWAARIEDMRALSRMIGGDYIAAGHSFGALTALTLCGVEAEVPPGIDGPLADPHATCAIAFSPPGPAPRLVSAEGYAALARPALIQTGTRDIPPTPGTSAIDGWRSHFTAFEQAPLTGEHYGLLLTGVDHYFGGLICDYSKTGPDQRAALAVAVRSSLAFIKAKGRRSYHGTADRKLHFVPSALAQLSIR